MEKIDVLINVFSKPWQTALALLTLNKHSRKHIDKIYFHEEPAHFALEKTSHDKLLSYFGNEIIYFQPTYWLGVEPTDCHRMGEEDYRLAMRYQFGFENSDKKYVLVIHNDIIVFDDIVHFFMNAIEDYSGIGQIGQCWWCPASQKQLCNPTNYLEYQPDFETLNAIYTNDFKPLERRAYHYGWGKQFQTKPWPLPECRLNEWCMLIDREKTSPDTLPWGKANPLGAQVPSGACIGKDFDEPVNLDTGVQWFRDLSHAGHRFKHVNIYNHIIHDKNGHSALLNPEIYVKKEIYAKKRVKKEFPEFIEHKL